LNKIDHHIAERTMHKILLAFLFLLTTASLDAQAAMGDLDTSFGIDGKVYTLISDGWDEAREVAFDLDERIVVLGVVDNGNKDIAIVRYNSEGGLDTTFGSGGITCIDIHGGNDQPTGLAVDSSNRIVVAGYSLNGANYDITLLRYDVDGYLDTGFGAGGVVTTAIGTGHNAASDTVFDADGKIVVSGYYQNDQGNWEICVLRYNTDGSLDDTFGSGGVATVAVSADTLAASLAIDSAGRIVIVGGTRPDPGYHGFLIIRLLSDGTLDTSFGSDGKVTTNLTDYDDLPSGVSIETSGKIIVAGRAYGVDYWALVRYNPDGSLDDEFGSGGDGIIIENEAPFSSTSGSKDVIIDANGNILLTGYNYNEERTRTAATVIRYRSDGSRDASFGSNGIAREEYGDGRGAATALVIDHEGKIIVVGYTSFETPSSLEEKFALMRILGAEKPFSTTLAPTSITATSTGFTAIFNGVVHPNNRSTSVSFEYGTDTTYGHTVAAEQGPLTINTGTNVSRRMTGLNLNTSYHYRVVATNCLGTTYGADQICTALPTVTTTAVSNVSFNYASSGGYVTDEGGAAVAARGVCWSTSPGPTTADNTSSDGMGTGAFTSSLTGLDPATTYYVRAYAANIAGTSYGGEESFTTDATLPSVTTDGVTSIGISTATSGGEVTDDGGATVTARGVCWSTNSWPTIADNITSDGMGKGSFTSSLTGLAQDQTYYLRAYASNDKGVVYGNQVSFSTLTDSDDDGLADCDDNCPFVANADQADTDGDGTGDVCDACPDDPHKTSPGVCGCGTPDTDSDGDGTADCSDDCPNDPNKTASGICGCGVSDTDSDSDGTPDCNDGCPDDPHKTSPGVCGCGTLDTDSDGDGTADCSDDCPNDPNKTASGVCGCGVSDADSDGDTMIDCVDNCPTKYNPEQEDQDGDGRGSACDCDDTDPNIYINCKGSISGALFILLN
jgi:uncharacterized delta-60 repeat protein